MTRRRSNKNQQQVEHAQAPNSSSTTPANGEVAPASNAAAADASGAQQSRRSMKRAARMKEKEPPAQQQQHTADQKPAAKAPTTLVFPQSTDDAPAMDFAPPHTQLTPDIRAHLDELIAAASADAARAHLVAHMQRGLEQIEAFMHQQHTDVDGVTPLQSFEAAVARESDIWAAHVQYAAASSDMGVQHRVMQPSLQLALAGMDLKAGRPGRPDDAVYAKSAYAREHMPRGNLIAAWRAPQTNALLYFPVVRAYRKFTGQEDDGEVNASASAESLLSTFFTKPKDAAARSVISTTKENGEAGHLAVLKRSDGAFVFAVGSKNTHLLVQSFDDVDTACAAGRNGRSDGNDPYKAAAPLARALLTLLASLQPMNRMLLCEFLWQTRLTASFEILCPDHQHVQLLDFISSDTPVFYGASLPAWTPPPGAELCVNPVLLLTLMQSLGVRTVAFDVVPYTSSAEYTTALVHSIAHTYQHEGAVNVFVDDACCVIGLEKIKTVWYVSLRAIREKAKSCCAKLRPRRPMKGPPQTRAQVLSATEAQITKRFRAIASFVSVPQAVASAYAVLGHRFIAYLSSERFSDDTSDDDIQRARVDVAERFPIVWQEFLAHTGLSDIIVVDVEEKTKD